MADYYNKRLSPRIQPMQTLPVKNYTPGVYGGFSHANPAEEQGLRNELGDQFAAEVRNTAIRRREAEDIRSGNRARAAAESKEFFKSSPGRRSRIKMRLGKGQAFARTMFSFAEASKGYRSSRQPGQLARAYKELGNNPNAGRLTTGELSEYAHLKAPSKLGFMGTSLQQRAWDRQRIGELHAKLYPGSSSGRRGLGAGSGGIRGLG